MKDDKARASLNARGTRSRVIVIAVAAAGLALLVFLVGKFGLATVAASIARMGFGGFVLFTVYALANYAILGWGWFLLAPGLPLKLLAAFYWGRLMREAASDVLPFSQLGGLVIGARAAETLGAPRSALVASTMVDLSAELVGQILFIVLGVVLIAMGAGGGSIHQLETPVFVVGFIVITTVAVAFMFMQWKGIKFLRPLSVRWLPRLVGRLDAFQAGVDQVYRRPLRLCLCVFVHLIAWVTAIGGVWLALRLIHAPISFEAAIGLESLISILRSAAFLIPGAIGVQEGGYVLLGPMFGLPPEAALALSLIKRGRDLVIGAPAVLLWQAMEGRRFANRCG